MRQMPFILVGLLIILCMGVPKAQAILYLTKEEALKIAIPGAEEIRVAEIHLNLRAAAAGRATVRRTAR